MSGMRFIRSVQSMLGLGKPREYPNLELLLEREAHQAGTDYRLFSYLVPSAIAVFGALSLGGAAVSRSLFTLPGALVAVVSTLLAAALAVGTFVIFNRLHKSVPQHRIRIRELVHKLHHRYEELPNIVGAVPTLAPDVAEILDAGAHIYLKHVTRPAEATDEPSRKTRLALEAAMAKLLELGQPESPAEQQIELARGWALPLLQEMVAAGEALDQAEMSRRLDQQLADNDPLAHLRASRIELQETDKAITELDQRQ